jgi:uncharacterized protein YndB with AHSA1/START domain
MSTIHVEVSETINARPEQVYAVLSDYHAGHRSILPKPYFTSMHVEQGGQGAGTVVRVNMNVFGAKREYHITVSEPVPGRVLSETDPAAGVTTTFTVEPVGTGSQSRVTIATDSRAAGGIRGFLERLMNPSIMRRIYKEELKLLAEAVSKRQ